MGLVIGLYPGMAYLSFLVYVCVFICYLWLFDPCFCLKTFWRCLFPFLIGVTSTERQAQVKKKKSHVDYITWLHFYKLTFTSISL